MMLICFASHISFLLLSMSLSSVDSSSSILSGTILSALEVGFFCPAEARWHWPLVTLMMPKFLVLAVGIVSLRASGKSPGIWHVNIIRNGKVGSPDQPSIKSNGLPFPGKCASWEEQGKIFFFLLLCEKTNCPWNQIKVKYILKYSGPAKIS